MKLKLMLVLASVGASLLLPSAASAFAVVAEAPPNGYLVKVPRGSGSWVRFTVLFRVQGCFHPAGSVGTRFSNMQFAPASGTGERWFEMLARPDNHNFVRQMGPMPYTEAGFTVVGDALIPGFRVSNGELLRWTITAFCKADLGGPTIGELQATVTGTLRIKIVATTRPPAKKPPTKKPPAKQRHRRHHHPVTPFRITRIDSPPSVKQNGPRGTALISWSGHPTFPLTMHDAPATCPTGFNCSSEAMVVQLRANPLAWDAWWCAGTVTSNWTLDYWFWLTDAKGHTTQKVREQATCDVG